MVPRKNRRQRQTPQQRQQQRRRQQDLTTFIDYESDARTRQKTHSALSRYFEQQAWVGKAALLQLLQTPLSTLMTAAVIAIALALPTGLFLLLTDLQKIVSNWQGNAQVSLFMKKSISDQEARLLTKKLQTWEEISNASHLSAAQALDEFQQQSGFGDALDILQENPLPAVIIVKLHRSQLITGNIERLTEKLRELPQVDIVQLDFKWIQRLNSFVALGKRGALLLSGLLAVAVLLIIGNTIRLTIHNRRQEILVTKLIGATNQFIRKPFLYAGFWYGLMGAVFAVLLIALLFWLISDPIHRLSVLYNSTFQLSGLGFVGVAYILAIGVVLGLTGSWIAVTRHIHAIEPK
ncbi:MAG: cell division protein FtsX [Gammaproteobacteria bacterium]|nr:cell division protein FtsX [Gammaproteobacteria bacterium]